MRSTTVKSGVSISILFGLCLLSGSNHPATAGAAPYGNIKLTSAERAQLASHLGKRLGYHESIERSSEFPEVLRIVEYIDDLGPRTEAMIVDGVWIDWSAHWMFWIPEEATHRVLQARGWSTLDDTKREALALRWIIDTLPPGFSAQTGAGGGHAPEVAIEGGDVVVKVWLFRRFTSIAGPRVTQEQAPRVFRFKQDGSMIEQKPAAGSPPS
jgi:hypothetical protein